jgi:Rrf2 family protein
MRLTSATVYALRALAYLARHGGEGLVPSHVLGRGMSGPYLLKALKALESAGVLHSRIGTGGGFRLARPAEDITLLDIIEAVDGPLRGQAPAVGAGAAAAFDRRLQAACEKAAETVRGRLRGMSLADLAAA